jgi:parallel beta-helix repeat protein
VKTKTFYSFSFMGLLLSCMVCFVSVTNAATYYVATTGSDSAAGTLASPFATIAKARDVILANGEHGATVYIRGGTYELTSALAFTAGDSGTIGAPNVYRAYPGENVVISGGTASTPTWTLYKGSIYRTNVGAKRFRSLFVNGRRAIRAREPEEGSYYLIKSIDANTTLSAFRFTSGDINADWTNLAAVQVVSYRKWKQTRFNIDHVTGDKVYFDGDLPTGRGYNWDYTTTTGRYYVENVFEGLDTPGEWYLNNTTGYLYYWPLAGESINSLEFETPTIDQLVTVTSASYINFEDLTFAYTDWPFPAGGFNGSTSLGGLDLYFTISYEYADHCSIKNCVVRQVGRGGIGSVYGKFITVTGNQVYDAGGAGVDIYDHMTDWGPESYPHYYSESCNVSYNTIHDIGVISKDAPGIYATGIDETVSHNKIYNMPYIGIQFKTAFWREDIDDADFADWKPNIIFCNEIYAVMHELNDGGAIYVDGQQRGSIIENNYCHDILYTPMHTYTGTTSLNGIYLDQSAKEFTVRNNIVARCETGLLLHAAVNNVITNNIFVDSKKSDLVFSASCIAGAKAWRDFNQPGNRFTKNVIYNTQPADIVIYMITETDANAVAHMNVASADYNLFYTTHPENKNWNISWWKKTYGFDQSSSADDPLFVDYAHQNFKLKENSPAYKLGFKQIPVEKIGLHQDKLRAPWLVK